MFVEGKFVKPHAFRLLRRTVNERHRISCICNFSANSPVSQRTKTEERPAMNRANLILAFLITLPLMVPAQRLPMEMSITEDGRRLTIGGKPSTGLYDSAILRTVELQFSQPNYWQTLKNNYASGTDLPATMIVDGKTYDSVGVRFKGQTSYTQFQNSDKKSFNITMDYAKANQDLMGYSTLNFNNSAFDHTFIREVFYLHQIRNHIPAAKANYIRLSINGQDWGLYPNVQQINRTYLSEWFLSNDGSNWRADRPKGSTGFPGGWGDGTAAMNYLGSDTTKYQTYYTLKSSNQDKPWDILVATCNALNNTSIAELPTVLPAYLDIDRTLWFLACEIAFTDDDGYVFKGKMDYFVYYEPETGRMTPLEFDGNTVMESRNVNWSPFYNETKANYPLLNKILAVPQWRQRYLAHMRTVISALLDPASCNRIMDSYKAQIDTIVQRDPKKIYSYNQFVTGIESLKTLIANRRNVLSGNVEVSQTPPIIQTASYSNPGGVEWKPPAENEEVIVRTRVTSTVGISQVNLYFAEGFVGNFTAIQMFDDGRHDDYAANDGVYGARIPGKNAGTWVRFYIEAAANNAAKSVSYFPAGAEHDVFIYRVNLNTAEASVVINEVMASNSKTASDEADQFDDWIELYNRTGSPIDLGGYSLTDNPALLDKWKFPAGSIIPADGYLIVWADEDGKQGPLHANFKLSADGEMLMLLTPEGELMDSISFGPQVTDLGYARVPNGTGPFRIQDPTFEANNNTVASIETLDQSDIALTLYPQPSSGVLTVSYRSSGSETGSLALFDIFGRLLKQYQTTVAANGRVVQTVNLDKSFAPGTYIVQATVGKSVYRKTFVLIR